MRTPGTACEISEQVVQILPRHVTISYSDYAIAGPLEHIGTRGVIDAPVRVIVHITFELQNQLLSSAHEVHDEPPHDALAAKLQAEHTAVAE